MTTTAKSKGLTIALWVAQGLISLTLIWAGFTKLFQPIEQTAEMLPWALDNPGLLKFTGIIDLLGGIGIVLPAALRIQPKLTVFAAYGVIVLMIAASIFHISRGEASLIGMNIFFLALAVFVAWGRTKKAAITSK
ncbi:DoxX family protein [Algoriphagus winogradskyi]|uniref:DoxX-like family protein n=1 Tax=Algoriphagus winogradskyi TaxID=237017 RepID=A0ABY1PAR4_9BACT|nr:DoxX family protein [Algoriphagus winogradskyi]SMP29758.1 DoxX-like family protein [Algoriphagus winogradskyi]